MFKKISVLLLSLIMLLGAVPVQARLQITEPDEQIEVLSALGVDMDLSYKVTESDFLELLAELLYDDLVVSGSKLAEMMGVTKEDEFTPTNRITYENALKYCVIVLGYKIRATAGEDYYSIAADLGLTEKIYLSKSDVLSKDTACQLLINMFDVEPLRLDFEGGKAVYKKVVGGTILSLNRDIVTIKGIVTANSVTSLSSEYGTDEGKIEIDGTEYYTKGDFEDLLGKSVYGFVKKDSKDDFDTVIYLAENQKKNNILNIQAGYFDDVDGDILTYVKDKNGNVKTAKLNTNIKVIYNGVFYDGYGDTDLMPQNGEITLIDNNNDKTYDVAYVTSLQTMVVASVSAHDEIITNRFSFTGVLDTLDIKTDNKDLTVRIYDENGEISIRDIKTDDVLSVAKSRGSANNVITVYKSSKVFTGIATSFGTDDKIITIDSAGYPYIEELDLALTAENKRISVGNKHKFYVDYFGNVVYAKYIKESDYYVFRKSLDVEGEYVISYMDVNEQWLEAPLDDKVIINTSQMNKNDAYNVLNYVQPQVAKIYFRANGKVKKIQFATTKNLWEDVDDSEFIKRDVSNLSYRLTPKSFGGEIWLEDGALMFIFPADLTDKTKYGVQEAESLFKADTKYVITAYDFDKFGFTNILSMHEAANEKTPSNALFLVTKKITHFVDGEVITSVMGACSNFTKYQLDGENEHTFDGVDVGDVIRVHTNREGRVDYIENRTHIKTANKVEFVQNRKLTHLGNTTSRYNTYDVTTGTVREVDLSEQKVMIDAGEYAVFRLKDTIPVTIYDSASRTTHIGSIYDLTKDDVVVCRTGYLQIQEMFIIRY